MAARTAITGLLMGIVLGLMLYGKAYRDGRFDECRMGWSSIDEYARVVDRCKEWWR